MSYRGYIVEEHPIRVMVNPYVCDGCGRDEAMKVLEVAECAEGDELDGCNLLATEYEHAAWLTHRRSGDTVDQHYCPDCAAPYIPEGETWTIAGVQVNGTQREKDS